MVDRATIYRSGAPVFDETTGRNEPVEDAVHEGKCRLRWPSTAEQSVVFGETVVTRVRAMISFPHDVDVVRLGDVIRLTASGDATAVGRPWRIVAVPSQTFNMYREYGCEAVEE